MFINIEGGGRDRCFPTYTIGTGRKKEGGRKVEEGSKKEGRKIEEEGKKKGGRRTDGTKGKCVILLLILEEREAHTEPKASFGCREKTGAVTITHKTDYDTHLSGAFIFKNEWKMTFSSKAIDKLPRAQLR